MGRPNSPLGLDEDEDYLASVSDLMVGMLFVFILMLMAFALSYRGAQTQVDAVHAQLLDAKAELHSARADLAVVQDAVAARREALEILVAEVMRREQARVTLLAALQHELLERSVPVSSDAANGVLRLSESLLFDSGSATLRPDGERALVQLAAVLLEILPCMTVAPASLARTCPDGPTPLLETLLVEGHTDAEPIQGGGFADNWEVATARSIGVFKALIAYAPGLESLRNEHGEVVLGVSGYEARRPVARASGEEARRLNRRIDLRFVLAGPGAIEIDRLRRRLDTLRDQ